MRSKDRSIIYDQLVAKANEILKKDNPCEVGCDGCLEYRSPTTRRMDTPFCCQDCTYLGDHGCTVEALSCKVWMCYTAQAAHPTTFIALEEIRVSAISLGIPMHYRGSKNDHLNNTPIHPGRLLQG